MAKIIKIASSTPRIANQFRTSRNSTTNPFKYQNFEGNTLDISDFADVFESSAAKDSSKLKLIAASVAGTMHKFVSGITEPIINFVSRVCSGILSAWDYAVNTDVSDIDAFKGISSSLKSIGGYINRPIEIPGAGAISGAIDGVKTRFGAINEGMLDLGKDISAKWNGLISKIQNKDASKISADLSVSELETLWKAEIAASDSKEAA